MRGRPIRFGIHQPAYHPNIYYFRKVQASDVFVSLDTVQFVAREWQNRQVFFHSGQRRWLTVPVNHGREAIRRKRVVDHDRLRGHWQIISTTYRDAPFYGTYRDELAEIYRYPWIYLQDLCDAISAFARRALAIDTPVVRASEYFAGVAGPRRADLLAELILALTDVRQHTSVSYNVCAHPIRADHYIMGRHGDSQLTEREKLESRGITVDTFRYRHPVYRQANVPDSAGFQRELSIVDLIFNEGPAAGALLAESGR